MKAAQAAQVKMGSKWQERNKKKKRKKRYEGVDDNQKK
jgi:hypothetical protein